MIGMALFGKKDAKASEDEPKNSAISKSKKEKVAIAGQVGRVRAAKAFMRPRITEKAHLVSGKNQYVFEVHPDSDKREIRKAAQELYGIRVERVTVVKEKPKRKQRGRSVGYTKGAKKAYITVKEGDTIDLFKE